MSVHMEAPVMGDAKARPSSAGVAWLRDKRILLAEDNITNQMVATQMLDALGARVEVASDGAEALEMIAAGSYDLFLIDIEMPRVSGLDVIRCIRSSPAPLRDAPVIAVTAYALREHREKIAEAGADGLIPKPLLGIEQFGRDIVALADQSYDRGGAQTPPPPEPEAPAGGLISMKVYAELERSVGAVDMPELLRKADQDLARSETALRRAAREGDRGGVERCTHSLASVAGSLGAVGVQRLCERLNGVAREGGSAETQGRLADEILGQLSLVRKFVAERLAAARG
ncbi:MAG: response regulator [Rubrimonas sp.]